MRGIRSRFHQSDRTEKAMTYPLLLAVIVWFLPGWLYRFIIKSTAWFWWPLAYLTETEWQAPDPEVFYRRTWRSLWGLTSFALSLFTVVMFVLTSVGLHTLLGLSRHTISAIEFLFLLDLSPAPWQALSVILAVLGVAIVLWHQHAYIPYDVAVKRNDPAMLAEAARGLRRIAWLTRVRFVCFLAFMVLVAGHTILALNSRGCWFSVPTVIEAKAHWLYRDRMPTPECPAGPRD